MATVYEKRRNEDDLWEVYDSESEDIVVVDGMPLTGLDEEEADEAVVQLNRRQLTPDNISETSRSGRPSSVA
jgi:CO dehydrogenase/acetyl-CoA synthase alpha subunit